jgi:hypothetical protein
MSNTLSQLELEHKDMVTRLTKSGEDILANFTSNMMDILHAACGVTGELIEFATAETQEESLEEAGDSMFYIRAMRNSLGLPDYDHTYTIGSYSNMELAKAAGLVIDSAKKYTMNNRIHHKEQLGEYLDLAEGLLSDGLESLGFTRDQALEHNINKLLKGENARYASGAYSDEQAAARADKASPNELVEKLREIVRIGCSGDTEDTPEAIAALVEKVKLTDAFSPRTLAIAILWRKLGLWDLFCSLQDTSEIDALDSEVYAAVEALVGEDYNEVEFKTDINSLLNNVSAYHGLTPFIINTAYPPAA